MVKPLYAVYGNCQSHAIAHLLGCAPEFSEKYAPSPLDYCFSIAPEDMRRWTETSAPRLGLLIAHNLHPGWRRDEIFDVAFIRSRMPKDSRVLTYFDIYYRGYTPEWVGPILYDRPDFCGYTNLIALMCYLRNLEVDAILEFYFNAKTIEPMAVEAIHRIALHDMHMNELRTDISAARYMEKQWRRKRLFLTYNHPSREVLANIVAQIHALIGLAGVNTPEHGPELLSEVYLPSLAAFESVLEEKTNPEEMLKVKVSATSPAHLANFFYKTYEFYDSVKREKLTADLEMQRYRSPISFILVEAVERHLNRAYGQGMTLRTSDPLAIPPSYDPT